MHTPPSTRQSMSSFSPSAPAPIPRRPLAPPPPCTPWPAPPNARTAARPPPRWVRLCTSALAQRGRRSFRCRTERGRGGRCQKWQTPPVWTRSEVPTRMFRPDAVGTALNVSDKSEWPVWTSSEVPTRALASRPPTRPNRHSDCGILPKLAWTASGQNMRVGTPTMSEPATLICRNTPRPFRRRQVGTRASKARTSCPARYPPCAPAARPGTGCAPCTRTRSERRVRRRAISLRALVPAPKHSAPRSSASSGTRVRGSSGAQRQRERAAQAYARPSSALPSGTLARADRAQPRVGRDQPRLPLQGVGQPTGPLGVTERKLDRCAMLTYKDPATGVVHKLLAASNSASPSGRGTRSTR